MILYNFAIDVNEQAQAVEALRAAGLHRAALANARAAMESAIDSAYLVTDKSQYDQRGARARVFEIFELERLQRREDGTKTKTPGASPDVEYAIQEDAKAWEKGASGQGRLIITEWERFSRTPPSIGDHWSGHSRLELYRELAGADPDREEFVQRLDVVYGVLSIASHPRPRTGQRPAVLVAPDIIEFGVDPRDGERAGEVAELAVRIANGSLERRRAFDAPAA
ncbi:MAG: hypothetical protein ACYC2K_18860 [Gemmatimonadales bacterium]